MATGQFSYEDLQGIGAVLIDVSTRLDDKHGADYCAGLAASDEQDDVTEAITEFRDEWKASTFALAEDIGTWPRSPGPSLYLPRQPTQRRPASSRPEPKPQSRCSRD